jgi:hypothetical protein
MARSPKHTLLHAVIDLGISSALATPTSMQSCCHRSSCVSPLSCNAISEANASFRRFIMVLWLQPLESARRLISSCTDALGLGLNPPCLWSDQKAAILAEPAPRLPISPGASSAHSVELVEKDGLFSRSRPRVIGSFIVQLAATLYGRVKREIEVLREKIGRMASMRDLGTPILWHCMRRDD